MVNTIPRRQRMLIQEKRRKPWHAVYAVLYQTLHRAGQARIGQSAAGMAYYTLFSLFPLLLLLVSIGSIFLKQPEITHQFLRLVERTLPGSQILVIENIYQVVEARQTIGVIGLVTLLWSASNAFTALGDNIDAAWPETHRRFFLENRLFALFIIVVMITLLFVYILGILLLHLFVWLQLPLVGHLPQLDNTAWDQLSPVFSWMLVCGLLFGVYRWVPNTHVPAGYALASAAVSTVFLLTLNRIFTLLLAFVIQNYELVYGSLSAVLALMFYVYLSSLVVLAGAHLSSAMTRLLVNPTSQEKEDLRS
jgi:membrane protein